MCAATQVRMRRFPKDFMFGVATSSYQIEGAWNEEGKGENIWDTHLHKRPECTIDKLNADIACDSYHKFQKDIEALKQLGVQLYRFSVSWPRILPQGDLSVVNLEGIGYYNRLIDALLANGIQPMVTMYHWDLPSALQDFGGWTNSLIADYFEDYARLLFETFGDRVKWWITINEPLMFISGYSTQGEYPPAINKSGVGDYLAGHNALLAHARAYHLYDKHFRSSQRGKISIALVACWEIPATKSKEDTDAADRAMQFFFGWFAHPIYSKEGDYPPVMRERVDANSQREGRRRSRLPKFSAQEVQEIRGSADFFAFNHYTSLIVCNKSEGKEPSHERDSGCQHSTDPSWPGSPSLKVVPDGFRKALQWIHKQYNGIEIIVTENGYSDTGELYDKERANYYHLYLDALLKAVYEDGVNILGYTVWSLLDNFEWTRGYVDKFGLFHVDFNDPERKRTPKYSSFFFRHIIKTKELPASLPTPEEIGFKNVTCVCSD